MRVAPLWTAMVEMVVVAGGWDDKVEPDDRCCCCRWSECWAADDAWGTPASAMSQLNFRFLFSSTLRRGFFADDIIYPPVEKKKIGNQPHPA
jgi:hypothetical protein